MIKFYDTCSLLELQSEAFNSDFLISNLTINELEQIKTSGTRDEEIKWKARQILHLLEDNKEAYEVVIYSTKYDEYLNDFSLPPNNDNKIVVSAYACDQTTEVTFVTSDLACKTIAEFVGLNTEFTKANDNDGYTGYQEVAMGNEELADFYSNIK